ncbi:glycosyltransferase [Novosphingobium sp. FSY-8]|uniref:Glycosyltransferase n=1 Tax=Novosphingobium ovatum TaxID=1908523 RepID=A0ABW9X9U8_9SPHN|nr:glycosyltransferase [Novosphingobium ovatum]NBC35301.1 glycosyltransferase [Novosphingobium ovatum]
MTRPILLFHRDYRAFQGGHQKVADYIAHTQASAHFTPRLYLAPHSLSDHPFALECLTALWQPQRADALFVAGMDWDALPQGLEARVPVINLIQHVRHGRAGDPRHAFLSRRALRICVSDAVAQAIEDSGRVNGPVMTIPAGIDLRACAPAPKRVAVVIAGVKAPDLAQSVAALLAREGVEADCLTRALPRDVYLARVAAARVAITLPDPAEGFYLPAVEAMAARCALVCPDALGNRGFCRDGETCLMPPAAADDLAAAALRLLRDHALAERLIANAEGEARRHGLMAERAAFQAVLQDMVRAAA